MRIGPCGVRGGEAGRSVGSGIQSAVHRAAPVTRDTGPSAVLSQDGAYTYTAPPAPPCGRTGLTRSGAGPASRSATQDDPMHGVATPIVRNARWKRRSRFAGRGTPPTAADAKLHRLRL